jgi:hypothetical protein
MGQRKITKPYKRGTPYHRPYCVQRPPMNKREWNIYRDSRWFDDCVTIICKAYQHRDENLTYQKLMAYTNIPRRTLFRFLKDYADRVRGVGESLGYIVSIPKRPWLNGKKLSIIYVDKQMNWMESNRCH